VGRHGSRDAPLRQTVTVNVGKLALEALSSVEELGGSLPSARLESAIKVYLGDRDLGRPGWRYPDFVRGAAGQQAQLELEIDDDLWRSFAEEADRQRVAADRLAEQAAFYLAAEVDAGRIAHRMLDGLEPSESSDA
jgi:hypothetical protein